MKDGKKIVEVRQNPFLHRTQIRGKLLNIKINKLDSIEEHDETNLIDDDSEKSEHGGSQKI